ncbi:uncharacterized protein FIBRA_05888 [Fibroporia radiculosa]|uniref:Beta-hexosaminidase n=1 Tax=Fibroporia radiculosa TaxID=599839 RepID=J4HY97_9APHY|nr:uncharacterized protein FIBRA_05888 [Fibroporia radiculosa]CCM03742.1 predicted protein [Fibroporia radiculosa]
MLHTATVLVASVLAVLPSVHAFWPKPTNITEGTSALRLAFDFHISISPDIRDVPQDLYDAVTQTQTYVFTDDLGRLVVGRGAGDVSAFKDAPELSELVLSLTPGAPVLSITQETQKPVGERDEAYTLSIPSNGSPATITAGSTLGLFRGLTTFTQAWYQYESTIYTLTAPIDIKDTPAFPYRGLLIDSARHYFPVSDLLLMIDAMSWTKINEFHWHVVDSQSFGLQVPGFMELSTYGAYGPDMLYTLADVEYIVAYAGARGVDVIVEIDTPGHTAAFADSHSDYVACNQARPWATYAAEPPAGQLRLANYTVANYTARLFSAVADMFPSNIISTGGDEVNLVCYQDDYETQYDLNSTGRTLNGALNDFVMGNQAALIEKGKTPAVWEEMILDFNLTLSNETIVYVWISSDDVAAVADKGYRVVHAASNYFYLDCGAGGWVGDDPNGDSWCDPFKTWQYTYTFDPYANLTSDQYHLIMGGQANIWTEQTDSSNIQSIIWPRAASSAEVFWTGPGGNGTAALPRLHALTFRMIQRGLKAIPLQPYWCAIRAHECDLYW